MLSDQVQSTEMGFSAVSSKFITRIAKGEIVTEYVGEIISNRVADHREKLYNLRGYGDIYMFRLDDSEIV